MGRFTYQTARVIFLTAGLGVLVACGEQNSGGSFYREAGSQIDAGEFGRATVQNLAAQTCTSSGYGLGKAGTAPADPLVVLDPVSTPKNPVYRIHCDGRLDGKYARVVHTEYVESATQIANIDEAVAQ